MEGEGTEEEGGGGVGLISWREERRRRWFGSWEFFSVDGVSYVADEKARGSSFSWLDIVCNLKLVKRTSLLPFSPPFPLSFSLPATFDLASTGTGAGLGRRLPSLHLLHHVLEDVLADAAAAEGG